MWVGSLMTFIFRMTVGNGLTDRERLKKEKSRIYFNVPVGNVVLYFALQFHNYNKKINSEALHNTIKNNSEEVLTQVHSVLHTIIQYMAIAQPPHWLYILLPCV